MSWQHNTMRKGAAPTSSAGYVRRELLADRKSVGPFVRGWAPPIGYYQSARPRRPEPLTLMKSKSRHNTHTHAGGR